VYFSKPVKRIRILIKIFMLAESIKGEGIAKKIIVILALSDFYVVF
jgi:hypothetical protein